MWNIFKIVCVGRCLVNLWVILCMKFWIRCICKIYVSRDIYVLAFTNENFPHWYIYGGFIFICVFLHLLLWCEGIRKLIFLHISVSRRFFFIWWWFRVYLYILIFFFYNKIKYLNIRKFTSLLLMLRNLNINHNLISKCVNKLTTFYKKIIANIFHLTYLSDSQTKQL